MSNDTTVKKIELEDVKQAPQELTPEQAEAATGGLAVGGFTTFQGVPDIIVGSGPGGPAGHTK